MRSKGIEVRHREGCARQRGRGRCTCSPAYRAVVFDRVSGRKLSETFGSLREAAAWRERTRALIATGELGVGEALSLREAAARFLADAEAGVALNRSGEPYKPSAVADYRERLERLVLPRLGGARLRSLRRRDLQTLVDRLTREGRSSSDVRAAVTALRALWRYAAQRGFLEGHNPTRELSLPAPPRRRERVLTPAEAARLLAAIRDPRDRAAWATAFYAGLRRGELLGLYWQDIDLAAGILHVRRAYDPAAGATIPPKSKAGERTLAIPEALYDELTAWRAHCPWQEGLVFGDGPTTPPGLWRLVERPRRDWRHAGLTQLAEGVTLHVARHCFVTWCAEGGVGADILQRAAGHSSVTVTLDIYRHVLDRTIRRPAELLQAYIDADLERERRKQQAQNNQSHNNPKQDDP